jgi:uncharacterized SAM-binding protein YcdF (DUF218 family)
VRRVRKVLFLLSGGLAMAALVLYAMVSPLAPWLLMHRDAPGKADALVVLGGDARTRTPLAISLFRQDVAPMMLLSGRGDYVWVREGLLEAGVPADRILVETRSSSTRENALFSAPILRAHGFRRIVVVTSWQHSARALRTFRRFVPDVRAVVVPTEPRRSWIAPTSRRETKWVYQEFAKTLVYCLAYGVCPVGRL